jgi:hypothetical protein
MSSESDGSERRGGGFVEVHDIGSPRVQGPEDVEAVLGPRQGLPASSSNVRSSAVAGDELRDVERERVGHAVPSVTRSESMAVNTVSPSAFSTCVRE